VIHSGVETDLRWRCKVESSQPAHYVYSILVDTLEKEEDAETLAEGLKQRGHQARVLPFGREVHIGGEVIHAGHRYRVVVGAFEREQEARPAVEEISEQYSDLQPHLMRHRISDPSGKVEVYDAEYDRSAMVETGFRIAPEDPETEITVYDIPVGVGFHWEHSEDRVYRGVLEVRIDNTGNLMAINELLLDDYLCGVIPSEMHHSYPAEALKAQAVAARSYTVAKLASRPSNDPMDFPATVHFQVYSGVTRQTEETTYSVRETTGEVLKAGNRVCEAYFSSNSGGHTESKEFWNPPGEPYLEGRPVMETRQAKKLKLDLRKEGDVAEWVRSHPDSWSNPRGTGINLLDRNARYFRWEVTYGRRELEDILKRKLGFDVGTLVDIQPLQRGVSGRITELEILGSHRNHKVRGELNIRRVLGESTLNSSCFVVDLTLGDLGDPVEIKLIGAGFGHGVGMDQTAAGVMAHEGKDHKAILKHFYKGAKIEKIW
jgi:peptidoglycan hydrolase-like amidase